MISVFGVESAPVKYLSSVQEVYYNGAVSYDR
jgi:hypothetical protein